MPRKGPSRARRRPIRLAPYQDANRSLGALTAAIRRCADADEGSVTWAVALTDVVVAALAVSVTMNVDAMVRAADQAR